MDNGTTDPIANFTLIIFFKVYILKLTIGDLAAPVDLINFAQLFALKRLKW